jgi:hypothetical protein
VRFVVAESRRGGLTRRSPIATIRAHSAMHYTQQALRAPALIDIDVAIAWRPAVKAGEEKGCTARRSPE